MKILQFYTSDNATKIGTIIALVGLCLTVWSMWPARDFPFLATRGDLPAVDCYFMGPDGKIVEVNEMGKGMMPGDWKNAEVRACDCKTHRKVHTVYPKPAKGKLLEVRIP